MCPSGRTFTSSWPFLTAISSTFSKSFLWTQRCSHDLHQNPETSSKPFSPGGHSSPSIPRRLDHLGPEQDRPADQPPQDYLNPKELVFPHKLRKISANSSFRPNLARSPLVLTEWPPFFSSLLPSRKKFLKSKSAPPCQKDLQKKVGVLYGEISLPRSNPQAPASKNFSPSSPSVPSPDQAQGQEGSTPRSSQGKFQTIDFSCSPTRSNALPSAPTKDRPLDRCVFIWLGSTLRRRSLLPRALDQTGTRTSHQHAGSASSHQGYRSPEPRWPAHLSSHRQRSSEVCHKQTQVESVSTPLVPLQAMPPAQLQQPQHHRLQDPVLPEPNSGCAQQGSSSPNRMVPSSGDFQQNHCLERPSGGGPNDYNTQQKGGIVCLPDTTSSGCSNRREDGRLEQVDASVCLPPEEVHNATPSQTPHLQTPRSLHRPRQPTAPWFPALFQRAEGHLHLRTHLEQLVRSERVSSGFLSYERWTAFTF